MEGIYVEGAEIFKNTATASAIRHTLYEKLIEKYKLIRAVQWVYAAEANF
jgi:hypothetical protein